MGDQTKIESEEDAPVTAYYLWLPYLLTICFILARLPRSAWKRFFENRLIHHILKGKSENVPVQRGNQGNQGNFLCILGNNLFNQKYFFVLWLWWAFLLLFSALGVVYRAARMTVPAFSRVMLMRKVHGQQLATLMLSASEYFVLDLMVQNMESRQMELVLGEVEKQYKKRIGQKMGKMSDSLPSVIIDEPKAPSAPRHGGSDSSGFGSGKGEPTKGDYMTL